ncbi:MAG: hypothetical protein IPI96_16180 [Saprospiraceae bacterium]|nr:hypothetical protein [Saprospiraceae bacterium]
MRGKHQAPERPKIHINYQNRTSEWLPYILTGFKKVGILSDIHVPYHSITAITAALDNFVKIGIDCLLLDGIKLIFTDCQSTRKTQKRSVPDEIDKLGELNQLNNILKCKLLLQVRKPR